MERIPPHGAWKNRQDVYAMHSVTVSVSASVSVRVSVCVSLSVCVCVNVSCLSGLT